MAFLGEAGGVGDGLGIAKEPGLGNDQQIQQIGEFGFVVEDARHVALRIALLALAQALADSATEHVVGDGQAGARPHQGRQPGIELHAASWNSRVARVGESSRFGSSHSQTPSGVSSTSPSQG